MAEPPTLLIMAVLNIAAALFFALTAREVSTRQYSAENRAAGLAFTLSWIAMAGIAMAHALRLLVAWGYHDLILYDMSARVIIILTAVMIAGFGYYVAFLGTGKRFFGIPIVLFAATHALLFLYFHTHRNLIGIITGTWEVAIVYENPSVNLFGLSLITYVYYFAPPVLLALGYLGLVVKYTDRRQRMRALTTGLVVFVYHVAGFMLAIPGSSERVLSPIALILVVIVAAAAWTAQRRPSASTDPQRNPTA
jgi:hypothetical protein